MAHRVKSDGYLVRNALNEIERSDTELTRVLERLLSCESVAGRAALVAQGALSVNKRSGAVRLLRAVLMEDKHE
jgi:hypothetical protein